MNGLQLVKNFKMNKIEGIWKTLYIFAFFILLFNIIYSGKWNLHLNLTQHSDGSET